VQEKKQQQLAALDSQYQAKIMSEVERFQALLQEKELLNHKWDEQNATLVEAHEKVVQEITEELEAKLMEEQMNYSQLVQQRDDMAREFDEVKAQLEEDADRCARPPTRSLHWTSIPEGQGAACGGRRQVLPAAPVMCSWPDLARRAATFNTQRI
jgi:hypothetical protein